MSLFRLNKYFCCLMSLLSHIIEITGTKFPSSLFSAMLIWSL
uniref:Uncharacterized protein n=1 Tax=Solanum lycopersicum TaxID=4081 RepID=A0A3Q7GTY4_SOLLC